MVGQVSAIITQALDYFMKVLVRFKSKAREFAWIKVKLCCEIWVIYFDMSRTQPGLVSAYFADPAVREPVNEIFRIGIVMQWTA